MPISLNELIRRGDVCFYCLYHIGDTGRPLCPECGRVRPEQDRIAKVQKAIRIGKIGFVSLLVALGALGLLVLYFVAADNDPFGILLVLMYLFLCVFVLGLANAWIYQVRRPSGLFLHPWRLAFVAAYPWLLLLGLVSFVGLELAHA